LPFAFFFACFAPARGARCGLSLADPNTASMTPAPIVSSSTTRFAARGRRAASTNDD